MDQQTSTKLVKICDEVEKLEKDLNFWKNRCEFFETKYKELNDLINGGDYDVVVEKKPEIEHVEIKTDSLIKLILLATQSPTKILSVTIEEKMSYRHDKFLELPNIRQLVVKCCNEEWETFFNCCRFPNIEELWLDFEVKFDENTKYVLERNFEAIFSEMKDLKHLYVSCDEYMLQCWISFQKLESAYISYYHPDVFLGGTENTLKSLIVGLVDIADHERAYQPDFTLDYIYENFKKLERLTVHVDIQYTDNATIPVNNSITFLNIYFFDHSNYEFFFQSNTHFDNQALEKILIASPSVKTLVLREKITSKLIQFIATNMMNLEMLVCLDVLEDGVLDEFEEIRKIEADNVDVNTKFKIKIKQKLNIQPTSFSDIEKTYKYYSNDQNSDKEIGFGMTN